MRQSNAYRLAARRRGTPCLIAGARSAARVAGGLRSPCLGLAFVAIVLAAGTARSEMFQVGLNFTGTTLTDETVTHGTCFIPPDTMGAVGPNHIVELINGDYAVYAKSTGNLIGSRITLDLFWQNALDNGPGGTVDDSFDPRVVYDHASARWFATAVDDFKGSNSSILLGVSDSSDPTAGWVGFRLDADSANTRWADFPTLGVDADGVYVSANMFDRPGSPFLNTDASVFSFPKADLLLSVPTVANRTEFQVAGINTLGFAVQPALDFGSSDGRAAMLARPNIEGLNNTLKRTDILNAAGTASLSATTSIPVSFYDAPPQAHQPGPDDNIRTTDHRFGSNVFEQGDSLWAVHAFRDSSSGNVRTALRWYEIDETNNTVLQFGDIADDDLDLYYPSIAANPDGHVVIGFSGSSDTQFISSYAVAAATDGGVTTFGDISLLKAGVASYKKLDTSNRNRWGDYSATVLDPVDPLHFWTFQEYVFSTNVWGIQVTEIILPEPGTLAMLAFGGLALCRRRRRRIVNS